MWKIQKYSMCKIIDESTGNIIAAGLEEDQAQSVCDKHNAELSVQKWNKDNRKNE